MVIFENAVTHSFPAGNVLCGFNIVCVIRNHRWRVMNEYPDIYEREHGMLPVTIIDKPLSSRMASTIRHNRARGTHDVDLMGNIVSYEMRFIFIFIVA